MESGPYWVSTLNWAGSMACRGVGFVVQNVWVWVCNMESGVYWVDTLNWAGSMACRGVGLVQNVCACVCERGELRLREREGGYLVRVQPQL